MQLEKLDRFTLQDIYNTFMVHDFPKSELKPLAMLQEQMEKGNCIGWHLTENKDLLAYAIFAKTAALSSPVLLDYYAVNSVRRGSGIGSICLKLLAEQLQESDSILLEVEAVEKATTEEERNIRKRRISFYKQNGCLETAIENCLFGVDFSIMTLPCRKTLTNDEVFSSLEDIYQTMMPPERYAANVRLSRKGACC